MEHLTKVKIRREGGEKKGEEGLPSVVQFPLHKGSQEHRRHTLEQLILGVTEKKKE
jgi:hypothetical protein